MGAIRTWLNAQMQILKQRAHTVILISFAVAQVCGQIAVAQEATFPLKARHDWTAAWIAHPTTPLREPAVFHFRTILHLDRKPDHFFVDVSADNRFIVFVNGVRIGEGPARGDLAHWRYESFDLAPALHAGDNIVAAVVWNWGIYAPLAQFSNRSAFLMQGESQAEAAVNTDSSWQVEDEPGFTFIPRAANRFYFYWAADPGERLDAHLYDWDWKHPGNSPESHWIAAATAMRESIFLSTGLAKSRGQDSNNPWAMVPDPLPPMEYRPAFPGHVVRTNLAGSDNFPEQPVSVPPHRHVEILLDRQTMISGYPVLTVSGGVAAHIRIGCTEALYDANAKRGNRNDVGNRRVLGLFDEFIPDGGSHRVFQPLWFRTWRYLELDIETGDAPLQLDSLKVNFSAFPFKQRGQFLSSDPELDKIWRICWRTARLDAHETYMDTPFWEQLQYIDDTRIQALIS